MIRKFPAVFCCPVAIAAVALTSVAPLPAAPAGPVHNVILFVPDGLRASMVDARTAPVMDAIARGGVRFANSHSIFPTFTTANASAMATGHKLGDTGDFSNTIATGYPVAASGFTRTPFLENDPVLIDIDKHFGGGYLDETTILAAAHAQGYGTASIGKLGPVAIFDDGDVDGSQAIVIDDSTGHVDATGKSTAWPLARDVGDALAAAAGGATAPNRGGDPGQNGNAGDATHPGATVANVVQQNWFVAAATRVVLPRLAAQRRPFFMVFWSRDPDGTQHNQGDSLGTLTPGIDGPTSLAAIRNADDDLGALRRALQANGLAATTDIIVAADHGFSTIAKTSSTSPSLQQTYTGVPAGMLPAGFLALDIGAALKLPVSDPDNNDAVVHPDLEHKFPSHGNGIIGFDASKPDVVVASNGGSDLVYLPQTNASQIATTLVAFLLTQDYVSGLFVDDALFPNGAPPGTLPMSAIDLIGRAKTPRPSMVVNFRSFSTGCANALRCTAEIADTTLQQGQGMHGSFSRADTNNFMAAIGPDFKRGFVDPAPASNADVGLTIARIMRLPLTPQGTLLGRPLREALLGGVTPASVHETTASQPAGGLRTVLRWQHVGATRYFDAAGFPGRTVGL